MGICNQMMLVTYADSLGKNLKELDRIAKKHLEGVVGGIHILPFYPSSADRGFAPLCYDQVDEAFGDYGDVRHLAERYYLMFDFMVNHISRQSEFFRDFVEKKDNSRYKDFFICYKDFWENGMPSGEQLSMIYKRKPRAPYTEVAFNDGTVEKVWCTFGEEQIDLNVSAPATKQFIRESLTSLCGNGASVIRLDAFAYAVKKAGTNCFFAEPDIWDLLYEIDAIANENNALILPEIHTHYSVKLKLAERGFWTYDFALPIIVLNALYSGSGSYLKDWLLMSPKHQFTVLDTHDGIGVLDGAGLIPEEELEWTKNKMFSEGANVKKVFNGTAYGNMDVYQVNTTYYSALGNCDDAYLLARAIQFFAPGIPQIYYVGLLAGKNDLELLEKTREGRSINRHYYTEEETDREFTRPVVQKLISLMRFRNMHPAFHIDGELEAELPAPYIIVIRRRHGAAYAVLTADLMKKTFEIKHS